MALIRKAGGQDKVIVTFVDRAGKKFKRSYGHEDVATLTGAQLTTFTAALKALTDCDIVGVDLRYGYVEDTTTNVSVNESRADDYAIINVRLETLPKTGFLDIPAPVIGIFGNIAGEPSNVIDPSDAAVIAFVGQFTAANNFLLSDGEHVADSAYVLGGRRGD